MRKRRYSSTFALVAVLASWILPQLPQLLDPAAPTRPVRALPRELIPNVNLDPAPRLQLLPRVGPSRAEAIVRERRRAGRYRELDSLCRVRGIGPRTVEALSDAARAGG